HIGPSEAETFWSSFLKSLTRRGLHGVKLVISDAHEGLKAAIRRVFGAGWHGGRRAAPGLPAARSGSGKRDAAARRRPIAAEMAKARRLHRRQRDRCAVLCRFPRATPQQIAQHQPTGAAQQATPPPSRRGRFLPQRSRACSPFGSVLLEQTGEW